MLRVKPVAPTASYFLLLLRSETLRFSSFNISCQWWSISFAFDISFLYCFVNVINTFVYILFSSDTFCLCVSWKSRDQRGMFCLCKTKFLLSNKTRKHSEHTQFERRTFHKQSITVAYQQFLISTSRPSSNHASHWHDHLQPLTAHHLHRPSRPSRSIRLAFPDSDVGVTWGERAPIVQTEGGAPLITHRSLASERVYLTEGGTPAYEYRGRLPLVHSPAPPGDRSLRSLVPWYCYVLCVRASTWSQERPNCGSRECMR